MARVRPELLRGIWILSAFLILIVVVSCFAPYSVSQSGYTVVDIEGAERNPLPLEGLNVSSRATILSVENEGEFYVAEIGTESSLVFPGDIAPPEVGDTIILRGTCWIHSNHSLVVHEFYVMDYYSSIIRSIPGILIFFALFFMVFTIDISRLPFVERRAD